MDICLYSGRLNPCLIKIILFVFCFYYLSSLAAQADWVNILIKINMYYFSIQYFENPMKPINIRIDDETKAKMESYPDINWSEIIRRAIKERLKI